jgi:hypothetical protein
VTENVARSSSADAWPCDASKPVRYATIGAMSPRDRLATVEADGAYNFGDGDLTVNVDAEQVVWWEFLGAGDQ